MILFFVSPALSQSRRRQRNAELKEKKVMTAVDSLRKFRRDSLARVDSLFKADSMALLSKSSLERPAFSTAKDSIVEVFTDGARKVYYYGDVSVQYQDMTLTADYMEYDMKTGIVHARGTLDSLSGTWKGQPVMEQGGTRYKMEELWYNFNTRKANIHNMITSQEEGFLHGKNIKMLEDNSINVANGKYTVCDLEHPHYHMKLSVAKVMTKPNQKIVFGPANLVIEDVNLPFVAIPFGFVPERPQRATGMLMPTFGEEETRGFYLRDAGMYFVFGDNFDLSVTGDIFSLGSYALNINSRYKFNYKCNGNFAFNMSHDVVGEKGSADYMESGNFGLRWSHSQDSKSHPGSTFSASVNFSSPSNNRYNSHSVQQALQNQAQSSISYSRNWNGKMNLSVNALASQNSRDSSYAFTFPNVTFSVSTFYPFKQKYRVGKERFYEKISFGYNTTLQNKINFKASEISSPDFVDKFQNGMQHNFSIGLPTATLFKYITLSPSISYGQNWFFRATEYAYNPDTDRPEAVDSGQFGHFGITQNYSGGISASTRLYGMFNFGTYRKIQAIRHVVSPSISMSFSPEKGTYANGYRTLLYTDASGQDKEYQYNIYTGQMYGAPSRGKSATASISIGNNLEAKVRDFADTTGNSSKKVKLIDQLNINTGYNFLAEQFKMNTVSMSMSTSLFEKVSLSGSAAFDPYAIDDKGMRVDKFSITQGQGLLRFTNASFSLSYSLSGKGAINGNDGSKLPADQAQPGQKNNAQGPQKESGGGSSPADYYRRIYYHPITGEYIPGGWLYYTNPNVPWSVNLSMSFSYSRSFSYDQQKQELIQRNNITSTLSASGNLQLTPKLSLNANTGFDFHAMKITTTQVSARYDLHCFNISVSWVPTGTWKSYSFTISANAAQLSDLLRFKKSNSFWDN